MKRYLSHTAMLALFAAGCAETPATPSAELSTAEVQDLAPQTGELSSGVLDQIALAFALVPGGGRGGDSEFSRTVACPKGGEVRIEGSSKVSSGDRASGTFTVQHNGSKTLTACAFQTRDGTLVTEDGKLTSEGTRNIVNRQLSGLHATTQKGSIAWTRGTATGTCVVDLTTTIDPAARTATVKGTMCGKAVDRTRTFGSPRARP